MTIDKEKLKELAEAANAVTTDVNITMAVGADSGEVKAVQDYLQMATPQAALALLAEIERLEVVAQHEIEIATERAKEVCGARMTLHALTGERDQLKAENEELRKALGKISVQVDGNIRCAVRDVVNGLPDVQDIYGYCDNIDEIIAAAMAKEASNG
ncbi:hypothetical protein Q1Z72_12390 [Pseudomonas qingdaonensis]|uniref:hypothetical protein n=1 Tax=Pseudomonas qingdaonensis TaxID=2056231 RepID=UPI00265FBF9C|nr:hypothetical protein [Pseudomonas qingdaonensis]WKL69405.1 hypothetical protein Q1Z72_12390 [Pseudomonas qingdaonensis]